MLVGARQLTVDELRRGIEALDPLQYAKWGYYDKWAASLAGSVLERGLLTEDELAATLGSGAEAAETPRFAAGDIVRVRADAPGITRWRRPHLRVPGCIPSHHSPLADRSSLTLGTPQVPLWRGRLCRAAGRLFR